MFRGLLVGGDSTATLNAWCKSTAASQRTTETNTVFRFESSGGVPCHLRDNTSTLIMPCARHKRWLTSLKMLQFLSQKHNLPQHFQVFICQATALAATTKPSPPIWTFSARRDVNDDNSFSPPLLTHAAATKFLKLVFCSKSTSRMV